MGVSSVSEFERAQLARFAKDVVEAFEHRRDELELIRSIDDAYNEGFAVSGNCRALLYSVIRQAAGAEGLDLVNVPQACSVRTTGPDGLTHHHWRIKIATASGDDLIVYCSRNGVSGDADRVDEGSFETIHANAMAFLFDGEHIDQVHLVEAGDAIETSPEMYRLEVLSSEQITDTHVPVRAFVGAEEDDLFGVDELVDHDPSVS